MLAVLIVCCSSSDYYWILGPCPIRVSSGLLNYHRPQQPPSLLAPPGRRFAPPIGSQAPCCKDGLGFQDHSAMYEGRHLGSIIRSNVLLLLPFVSLIRLWLRNLIFFSALLRPEHYFASTVTCGLFGCSQLVTYITAYVAQQTLLIPGRLRLFRGYHFCWLLSVKSCFLCGRLFPSPILMSPFLLAGPVCQSSANFESSAAPFRGQSRPPIPRELASLFRFYGLVSSLAASMELLYQQFLPAFLSCGLRLWP